MLVIDSREKGTLPIKLKNIENEVTALEAGDYWISKEGGIIVIERSTYSDFVGKIMSGRLWEQIDKCLQVSDDVYFVLENPYLLKRTRMNYKAVIGAMGSASRKVKLFTTRNATETEAFIRYLHAKYNDKKTIDTSISRIKPKKMSYRESAIFMLMGACGIGEKTANKLLEGKSFYELVDQAVIGYEGEPKEYKLLREIFISK